MQTGIKNVTRVLASVMLLSLSTSWAQTAVESWVRRYDGPENFNDAASAIVVDGHGNVFVTGYSASATNFFNYIYDFITIAYSSSGTPLWTNRYNGPGNLNDEASDIAVDSGGNVLVTGPSANSNNSDFATIKYSGAGAPLWTNRYNGSVNGDDRSRAIVVDGNDDVIVTGYSTNTGSGFDFTTIKYSSTGEALWTNRYNGGVSDYIADVVVDGNSNVIVTGVSSGDYATIKYSRAGIPLWTNRYSGPGSYNDQPTAMAVDRNGNVVVTGISWTNGSSYDYATVKYSAAGAPLWTNRYDGPKHDLDQAFAIAVDTNGNVIVTGSSPDLSGYNACATVAYSSTGVPLWTNRYRGPTYGDAGMGIAIGRNGDVFVAASSYGDNYRDIATLAYSNDGIPLWTNRYNGPQDLNDLPTAIALDGLGGVLVAGSSAVGPANISDLIVIKYSTLAAAIPLEIRRVNNQIVLIWTDPAFCLQSAPAVTGTFTNIPGATSPFTNPISGSQQYFRLKAN